jgi:8-oxo-dGTP pyrophosphatase MutT (NUDIX family)
MEIRSIHTNRAGQKIDLVYQEGEVSEDLEGKVMQGVHAFCFCGDKLVLVNHPEGGWMPPGGGIEPGESYEEAVIREVKEETNMKVVHQELIGYLDVYEPDRIIRQTRSMCIVEPYGDFIKDPDNEITEIKMIDPKDYRQYFDWGEAGDRIMERALELKSK